MASYKNPIRVTYTRTVAGQTTATWSVSPPPGCDKFRVDDIQASVTGTAFVGTSTPAILGVGVAGNVNAAGYINFGTAGTPAPANSTVGLGAQKVYGTNPLYGTFDLTGTSNTIAITAGKKIPQVVGPALLTLTASTGGSPAGSAVVEVTLAWF
jgi:hypothetical protein